MWARTILKPLTLAVAFAGIAAGLPRSIAITDDANPPARNEHPTRSSLFKALHSLVYRERQAATDALLRLPFSARTDVEHLLASETDPEAVERLKLIAVHLMLKDPQETPMEGKAALMGIALRVETIRVGEGESDYRLAIVVMEVKLGFPAYEVLKAGDRIVGVEGNPLTLDYSVDTFRNKVANQRPGSFINLTILRGGAQSRVDVQLAGVGMPGDDPRRVLVEQRELKTRNYLANLKTGLAPSPLIMQDPTPTAFNIYNDIEIEDNP